VALGSAAHTSVGGSAPDPDALLVVWMLTAAVCVALHHRLLRVRQACVVATASQVLVHVAATGGPAAHHGHGVLQSGPEWGMALGHLTSAAATVLVLLWQDRVITAAAALLVPTVPSGGLPRLVARRRHPEPRRRPVAARIVRTTPLRGPPSPPAPVTC
jgi:hypothetical protein